MFPVADAISDMVMSFLEDPQLTPQEQTVLKLICEGYSNDEIQGVLTISKSTTKTHINHLHQKLPTLIAFRKLYL